MLYPPLDPCLKSHCVQGPAILFYPFNNYPSSLRLSNTLTVYFPFPLTIYLPVILRFIWSWLWTLGCCQQSSGLVLRAPPVHPVCPALHWELHSTTHYRGWEAYCLLSLFCSLCFPHSKTEKQRKSSNEGRGRERTGGGRQRGTWGLAWFFVV